MKKVIYLFLLVLGCTISINGLGQDVVITSLTKNMDSCEFYSATAGGLTTNIWGTTDEYLPGGRIEVFFGDGTSSDAYYWDPGQFSVFKNYATPGTYTVVSFLYDEDDELIDSFETTIDAYCKSVRVFEYYRTDIDCEYNGTDYPFSTGRMVEIRKAGVVVGTAALGSYAEIDFPDAELGVEFSLHLLGTVPGLDMVCESGAGFPYAFMLDTLNAVNNGISLGYECNAGFTGFDMAAYMTGFLRFVESSYLNINASNLTCGSEDAVITLQISPKYTYVTGAIPPSTISGNTLSWNVSSLSVGTGAFQDWITITPATTLTPGDTATHILMVTPTTGDANPLNNVFEFTDTIRASYDPNNKLVSPSGAFEAGEKMTYTINFENLGNDTAWNIHILDVMDNNLDLSTFRILSASHNFYYNFYKISGGQQMLRVDFPRIHLADASHPASNKGYIMYEVNAKEGLVIGDEIRNTADIYFDINPAIVTNTTVNVIPEPQSIEPITPTDGIHIFPNPATGTVSIDNKNAAFHSIKMVNTLGQVLQTSPLQSGLNTLNIDAMAKGVYYLILESKDGIKASKLIKK